MRLTAPRSLGLGVDVDVARDDGVFAAVDSHTEGMPTRVITAGVGVLPGATMLERKLYLERERDEVSAAFDARAAWARGDVGRDPAAPVRSDHRVGGGVHRGDGVSADVRGPRPI